MGGTDIKKACGASKPWAAPRPSPHHARELDVRGSRSRVSWLL